MSSYLKKILFVLIVFLVVKNTFAQENNENIFIKFLNDKIEVKENKTFFNILILENRNDKSVEFNLNINVPKAWKLIGNPIERINLGPHESRSIPVRVAVSKITQGGVGYSVNANIINLEGQTINSVSSYFSFPIKKDLKIKINNNDKYFDNQTLESTFSIQIINNGNFNEQIDLKLIPQYGIYLSNQATNESVFNSFELKYKTDTTLYFLAKVDSKIDYKKQNFFRINVETKSKSTDSLLKNTVWFKFLDWEYNNIINESDHPLVVKFTAQNLFSDSDIKLRADIYGKVLFKNHKEISYSFQNWNRINNTNNVWINSQWWIKAKTDKTMLILGDYSGSFEQNMYGRGFYLEQKVKNDLIKVSATKQLINDITNYGIAYKVGARKFSVESGLAYSNDQTFFIKNSIAYIKPLFSFDRTNSLSLAFGYNKFSYLQKENLSSNGFGYKLYYIGHYKKLDIDLENDYGTPNYVGYYKGKFNLNTRLNYKFDNKKNNLFLYLNTLRNRPYYIQNNEYKQDRFTIREQAMLLFYHSIRNNLILNFGNIYERQFTNNLSGFDSNLNFASQSFKLGAGVRITDPNTFKNLYISGRFGFTDINKYSPTLNGIFYPGLDSKTPFSVAEIRLSYTVKKFGLFAIYFNGPREITEQFSYFYNDIFSRTLSIMPYYDTYLYKKNLKLSIRTNYTKNIESSNSKYNINLNLSWFTNNNWQFEFLNSVALQQRRQGLNQSNAYYSSSYFEFSIKKIFNFKQPRIKFYDFNAEFFKDYNGNGVKDENEAGVRNVHVELKRQFPDEDRDNPNYNNEFISNELLSNQDGQIHYSNMPEGAYLINYKTVDDLSEDYYSESQNQSIVVDKKKKVYIPFRSKNKIFGQVILHRDRYTDENYSVQNIRVSVKGNNKLYTTLTNEEGYFEVVIPVSESYKIWVNNVFPENFTLRQQYYNFHFNGYKQYEVNFDFDEKKREVVFRDDEIYESDDVVVDSSILIQQTNLRGTVQSNKLYPIFANVVVRNSKGEKVSDVIASVKSGNYSTTFFTGKNYNLTVSFGGYWTHYEELNINQITTFDYITRNIMLNKIEKGEIIKTNNLLFDELKSDLSEKAKAELDKVAEKLKRNLDVIFEINGYTDNEESLKTDGNKLSENRAIAVMDYLQSKGINSNRMKPRGLSDSNPVVENNSKAAREQNRRVEFIVVDFNKEIKH